MVSNPKRRGAVADAALRILGRDGSRALTHRAVDTAATVPIGTCANYFPTRASMLLALAERIFERLTPTAAQLEMLARVPAADALAEYAGAIVERLIQSPDLARALIELRLEASRSPEIAAALVPVLRRGLREDVAFHRSNGLSGGAELVLQLHHVVNGIVFDQLTIPLDPESDPVQTAKDVARLLELGQPVDSGPTRTGPVATAGAATAEAAIPPAR